MAAMADMISRIPDAIVMHILAPEDSDVPLLDPKSLATLEVAGGGFARAARRASVQWTKAMKAHEWLLGPTPALCRSCDGSLERAALQRRRVKERALRLTAAADKTRADTCGHILLVGGTTEPTVAFASLPSRDSTVVRDAPKLHRLRAAALEAEEARQPNLQGRPFYRPLCPLRQNRAAVGAVRRVTDGAVFCLGGWDGDNALKTVERLDTTARRGAAEGSAQGSAQGSFRMESPVVADWRWRHKVGPVGDRCMGTARCFLGAAAQADGTVWALGGGSSLWQGAECFRSTEFLPFRGGAGRVASRGAGARAVAAGPEADGAGEAVGGLGTPPLGIPPLGPDGAAKAGAGDGGGADDNSGGGGGHDDDDDDDDDDESAGWGTDEDDDNWLGPMAAAEESESDGGEGEDGGWVAGPNMVHRRCGLGAAADLTRGDAVYVAGGYGGGLT